MYGEIMKIVFLGLLLFNSLTVLAGVQTLSEFHDQLSGEIGAASSDDGMKYYRRLPRGSSLRITLKSITLPAKADEITILGIGGDDFHYRMAFDGRDGFPFFLPNNKADTARTFAINGAINLSSDKILNPYIQSNDYNDPKNDWWFTMVLEGRVCLIRNDNNIIQSRYACFDPIVAANKMIEKGLSEAEFSIADKLDDTRGAGRTPFSTPMISTFRIELIR
jgi:hypothetical protein